MYLTQLNLFGEPAGEAPAVGPPHNGVATSKAAADSMAGVAPAMRLAVLEFIIDAGKHGATADEAQTALGIRPQTCSARCNELRRAGLIERDGRRRTTNSGRTAYVYIATGQGQRGGSA